MKYCSACSKPTFIDIPEGDQFARHICSNCGTIHYSNPKIVAGCIVRHEDRVLLCKRAIEPRYGYWTIPAGFMENHESVEIAAERETWEEAVAKVDNTTLYGVYSLPTISQVYIVFIADLRNEQYSVGEESLETELYRLEEIPWDDLAFGVVTLALERYVNDYKTGVFPAHTEVIIR